jgi:hypothetical protein
MEIPFPNKSAFCKNMQRSLKGLRPNIMKEAF